MPPLELSMTPPDTATPSERIVLRLRLLSLLGAAVVCAAVPTGILLNDQPSTAATRTTAHAAALGAAAGSGGAAASAPTLGASVAPQQPADPDPTPTVAPSADKQLTFDFQYQPTYFFCAPAATHMALSAHGANRSQDDLATLLDTTTYGTRSAFDTTRVLNEVLGKHVYKTREIRGQEATPAEMDRLQADVVRALRDGYAVVGNIIGAATDETGIGHDFPGGHYIAVIGYRDEGRTVQVADSSGLFGPGTYWMSTINMANWIATRGYSA